MSHKYCTHYHCIYAKQTDVTQQSSLVGKEIQHAVGVGPRSTRLVNLRLPESEAKRK